MACRSGDKALDEHIERFLEYIRPRELWRRESAAGQCSEICMKFVAHCADAPFECSQRSSSPDDLNYEDRSLLGYMTHTVCIVVTRDHQYMVDFTAAQYGYREYPMIQRRKRNGDWSRKWRGAEVKA